MATAKPKGGMVPYTRIETQDADTRVECAGAYWAGISEVPTDSLTPQQLQQLKDDKRLKVTEAEPRPAEETAQA
jgi:hypothetical protein